MSGDTAMAEAARATDLYQGMVASGAVATRAEAKVGMLGAMYGGTRGESGRMMPRLTRRYPRAIGLVEEAARAGERGEVVHTLLGRGSPVPDRRVGATGADLGEPPATEAARRRTATAAAAPGAGSPATSSSRAPLPSGRCAGWPTCATGCGGWAPTDRCSERPHLVFFLHDEVVVHTPEHLRRRRRRGGARRGGRGRPAAVRRLPGRLPARRRGRRSRGPTRSDRRAHHRPPGSKPLGRNASDRQGVARTAGGPAAFLISHDVPRHACAGACGGTRSWAWHSRRSPGADGSLSPRWRSRRRSASPRLPRPVQRQPSPRC